MNRSTQNRQKLGESGIVSIIVTMLIMVLLSLIVLGFAKVSRREQRQGLDRQLASQAKYAAESGINDAQEYVRSGGSLSATAGSECNTYAEGGLPGGMTSEVEGSIVNSCVLVSDAATELVYDGVGTDSELVVPVRSSNGTNIRSITVSWQGESAAHTSGNCPERTPGSDALVPAVDWKCPSGALRVDVVPISSSMTSEALVNSVIGVLLYPNSAAPVSNGETVVNGRQVMSECPDNGTSARACRVNLGLSGSSTYYLRIRPVYKSANIHITARSAVGLTSGSALSLKGAQITVDSTGRAADVLKRLVARVPACAKNEQCGKRPAGFALQTANTLCKLYNVIPPSTVTSSGTDPSCVLP